ncbi:MAG: tetratricopeptide repeat protein [Myxococcota bacterium]
MDDIERQLLAALSQAENSDSPAGLGNALDHLAQYYHLQKRYTEAHTAYKRALSIWRRILGADHPVVGTLLVNLGLVLEALNSIDEAASAYLQALTIFETDIDFADVEALNIMQRFAHSLSHPQKTDQAHRFIQRLELVAQRVHAHVEV